MRMMRSIFQLIMHNERHIFFFGTSVVLNFSNSGQETRQTDFKAITISSWTSPIFIHMFIIKYNMRKLFFILLFTSFALSIKISSHSKS